MEILNFSADEYKVFILILVRVSIFLFMFPVFNSPVVPAMAKVGLALLTTILLYPVVKVSPSRFPDSMVGFGILVVGEVIIGLTLGYTVEIFFSAVQLAGQIIGFQMGFSMINVIDPQSGEDLSILSQIAYLAVILIFILLSGHHIIIKALVESFRVVNMGDFFIKAGLVNQLRTMITAMFVLGIKMAAPAMAALIFTSAAFGICGKFVPQMNIMIVAFPFQIFIGLTTFGVSMEIMCLMTKNFLGSFVTILSSLMVWLGNG